MNLDTLSYPKQDARKAFLEYRDAIGATAEDQRIAQVYRSIASGKRVLFLDHALGTAGLGNDGFPRLAVVRADGTDCYLSLCRNGSATFSHLSHGWIDGRRAKSHNVRIRVPAGTFKGRLPDGHAVGDRVNTLAPYEWEVETTVPIIPPRLRPGVSALKDYVLLWEVEVWKRVPPKDPALLREVAPNIYAVVATWDLTPIERAVLRQTRS